MNTSKITVFTPTYNRGYIIENLYKSLQRQSFNNFEWIVIDDGSSDNTQELFEKWLLEPNCFKITYIKKENGGKHRAINEGVKHAAGELFLIADSDDYLTDDSLERISFWERTINEKNKNKYIGVCGCKGYSIQNIIGTTFNGEYLDVTTLEREKNGITGDKAEVFYTDVLKKYPFPEFKGENFLTECIVWDKIAYDGYFFRFFNEIIYICDYLPDGLTKQGESIFIKNPKGYGLYIRDCIKYDKVKGNQIKELYYGYYMNLKEKYSINEIASYVDEKKITFYKLKTLYHIMSILEQWCYYKDYHNEHIDNNSFNEIAHNLKIPKLKLRLIVIASNLRRLIRLKALRR